MRILKKIYRLLYAIYQDRRLLVSLSWQDFKRRFAGSYFGTLWGFITPLLTMMVYWAVFQFPSKEPHTSIGISTVGYGFSLIHSRNAVMLK